MNNNRWLFYISFLGITIFYGCADQITTEDDFKQKQPAGLSKLTQIQSNVFSVSCALSGCHGDDNTQAELNLSAGKAYINLLNVNSILDPGRKRILPGNSDESMLYRVLSYNYPTKMPPTGKLDQSIIDSIAAWINKGAQND